VVERSDTTGNMPASALTPAGVTAMSSTYLSLYYHIIFATKDRQPTIRSEWKSKLNGYFVGTVVGLDGRVLAVGGMADHVHLLVELKATHCLADFMRAVKRSASVWVHESQSTPSFAWQEGYAALTVGASSLDAVRQYIENQEEHHRTRSYREEVLALLHRAGVEVDQRYFD
jgi:putative transposase